MQNLFLYLMPKSKFILHDTIKSLKKIQKEKALRPIRDRLRGVTMIAKGRPYREIADSLGFSVQWVKKLAIDYTRDGLDGLAPKPYLGSACYLSVEQLLELQSIILEGPDEKELLSRYRISDLRGIIKKKWGILYSVGGLHGLLKRIELSHVTTRPQNPKSDPVVAALWKKKRKPSSTKKRKSIAALSSGTKMKRGSGKKASVTEFGRSRD